MRRFIVLAGAVFLVARPALAQVTNEGLSNQAPSPRSPEQKADALARIALDGMESRHEWGDAERADAKGLSEDLIVVWAACWKEQELRLRSSQDPVETIATAVLGSCAAEELLFIRAARLVFRGIADSATTNEYVTKLVAHSRELGREKVITDLVNYRLHPSLSAK